VSFERLVSGPGIELIYRALVDHAGATPEALTAPDITQRGLDGADAHCAEAIALFCSLLGTAASNLAVTLGAFGGIYIGGGIVPRLGEYFDRSAFRSRFEDKGRFKDYISSIPTYVITATNATLVGASAILASQLRTLEASPASALLEQIRRGLDSLSPAERRVAEHVLAHPRAVLNDPIVEIAKAAGVSQPTVIRFCRSLGCEGLSDFKLRLASGLTGTMPVTHAQVMSDDSMSELGAKVLGNTALAILQVRDQLNRDQIERAIDLINGADRIEFHAVGHYGGVALDAQFKFLRLGISSMAYSDPRLQVLAASVLTVRDVVVVISSTGRVAELLEVADKARERGAAVIAITASQSPLARKADVALIVDHVEDVATQLPMVSRILHLLVIDILAVGVAMRRSVNLMPLSEESAVATETVEPAATEPGLPVSIRKRRTPPGVSASLPLARLTSHSRR
jgi:glucokinase